MSRKQGYLTTVGTLACAVGIGFFMQSGQDAQSRYGAPSVVPKMQGAMSFPQVNGTMKAGGVSAELSVKDVTLTSAEDPQLPTFPVFQGPIQTSDGPHSSLESPNPTYNSPVCAIGLTATVSAAAMVNLSLDAPCLPNERLSILHEGYTVTYVTTQSGQLNVALPAFAHEAVFDVMFAGGLSATTSTSVDTLDLYERVAVQWTGEDALQLHAREFGAHYGEDGHVWAGSARDMNAAADGLGGFLTQHGHTDMPAAQQIEVYTFPKTITNASGEVNLTIEAEVSQATCGRNLSAKTLQFDALGPVQTRDFVLTVPGCEAEGDFLVLNNLFQDLKVAQN